MCTQVNASLQAIPAAIDIGTEEPAFPLSAIWEVVALAAKNQWIILGGDVLTAQREYANANWNYEPDRQLALAENVERSVQKAKQYIADYAGRNGSDFLLVLRSVIPMFLPDNRGGAN